ncbi:MAG: hypothetical protein KDK23_13435 [Leptospiraceae bacterium]|nr:hypothetical protein [Leptospiraceae bacterium]
MRSGTFLLLAILLNACYVYHWSYNEFPVPADVDEKPCRASSIMVYSETSGTWINDADLNARVVANLQKDCPGVAAINAPDESDLLISFTRQFIPIGWHDLPGLTVGLLGIGIIPLVQPEREATVTIQYRDNDDRTLVASYRTSYRLITSIMNFQIRQTNESVESALATETTRHFLKELDLIRARASGPTYETLVTSAGTYSLVRLKGTEVILPNGVSKKTRGPIVSRKILTRPIPLLR